MNKNEKMYDAITNIRDDIIEKAGEYKFEKKKRSFAWIGYAAAACLVLGAAVFGITRLAKKPMNTHEAAVPTEQTASVPTEDTRRIVTGKNGASDNQDAVVGQRLIEYSLEDAIKAPENDGCLFDVELWISNFAEVDAYIEEQWANVLDKQNDPAILHYNRSTSIGSKTSMSLRRMTSRLRKTARAARRNTLPRTGRRIIRRKRRMHTLLPWMQPAKPELRMMQTPASRP